MWKLNPGYPVQPQLATCFRWFQQQPAQVTLLHGRVTGVRWLLAQVRWLVEEKRTDFGEEPVEALAEE